ncbi:phage tail protein [Halomonas sp. MMSF_3323]|uniref:phage tail-collar fiber domain-containing protein n=1 Tax=Halomonas sp. MMSF_3323 TaxID=3046701 RepID=UPI00273E0A69|nr:phage tail protein [Halomonas sp. MMSF_3323]
MPQFYTLLTDTGQAKIANAVALGTQIEITQMAVGDGGGNPVTPDSSATALVNEVRRAPINAVQTDDDNPTWIVIEQVLPPDVGGWTIREVGVFDAAGDLIAIGNLPETYKPVLAEGSSRTQTIRVVMEVSDTAAVTLKVDPSVVLATREYVDQQRLDHEQSRNHPAATTTALGFVEKATIAEAKAGADDKFPDAAGVKAAIANSRADDQFANYDASRTYTTGEIARGSDGTFYEFYDRDQAGTVQGVDPTKSANRPHIWMEWHGVRPGSVIEWRSTTLPEGYIENDGAAISRNHYRRIFSAFGTTHGSGNGTTTFNLPDDRGEFKRGWDHGRGVDTSRNLAAHQTDALGSHRHTLPTGQGELSESSGIWGVADPYWQQTTSFNTSPDVGETAWTGYTGSPQETRPRNNAVVYLTKI